MLRVGLSGGIGSGKSTVARALARRGAIVIDADAIAREVVQPGRRTDAAPRHPAAPPRGGAAAAPARGAAARAPPRGPSAADPNLPPPAAAPARPPRRSTCPPPPRAPTGRQGAGQPRSRRQKRG